MDEWTNEEFFNPFGPNILRLKINEDIRLKILDLIACCMKNHVPIGFRNDILTDQIMRLENSIVDGKMGKVTPAQLTDPEKIIENTIKKLLCRYGEHYFNTPCISSIQEVWFGLMNSGDFHILHGHHDNGNIAELSGAIYLEVPDNLPDPQGNINWVMGGTSSQLYNPFWECSPKPGDIFLWPSWLLHTVYPFRSKQERLMISFNGAVNPIKNKEDNG